MKQIVFNVGAGLSTYIEFENKKILIDLGQNDIFNPITDFLEPLFKRRNNLKIDDKYKIDQLLISHPHNDHISSISDFSTIFYAELLTCPNDNDGMENDEKINWGLVDKNDNVKILRKFLDGRKPPLRTAHENNEFIHYLKPKNCENNQLLLNESYCNNISILAFFIINNHRILIPGDIQKEGMKEILKSDRYFRSRLNGGVDILVAPHHGLKSSFSNELFKNMKNRKTRCLNIVSEKPNSDDTRIVDSRYSSGEYCLGVNNLSTSSERHYQVKTSRGHILIDYSKLAYPHIRTITDCDDLISTFANMEFF